MRGIFLFLSLLLSLNVMAQNFDKLLNKANDHLFKKEYKIAVADYLKIVAANIGDSLQRSWAYGYIGVCNQELGNIDKAVNNYLKSISLKSPYVKFYKNLSHIYKEKKDYKGEEFVLLQLQKNLPHEYRKSAKSLAYLYFNSKQYQKLLPVCDELIAWYPKKYKYVYFKAIAYHQMDKIDEAISNYRKVITLKPNDFNSNNNLGFLLFTNPSKHFDKVVSQYETIAKPTDADYKKCKQKLEVIQKELLEAAPFLEKAYTLKPSEKLKKTLYSLYLKCNKKDAAKKYK